jgi:hypothetical protein
VAADAEGQAALRQDGFHHRADVGDEAVVAGHEFVKLAAGADVLVFKAVGFAGLYRSQGGTHDFFVDGGQFFTDAGEEAGDGSETVGDGVGLGGMEVNGGVCVGEAVVANALPGVIIMSQVMLVSGGTVNCESDSVL